MGTQVRMQTTQTCCCTILFVYTFVLFIHQQSAHVSCPLQTNNNNNNQPNERTTTTTAQLQQRPRRRRQANRDADDDHYDQSLGANTRPPRRTICISGHLFASLATCLQVWPAVVLCVNKFSLLPACSLASSAIQADD